MNRADDVLTLLQERGPQVGLVMDFDGVLSPITADPAGSQLLAGTDEILQALVIRLGLVALLSGRPVSFLADRVSAPGVLLLGSYGTEQRIDGRTEVLPVIRAWLPQVRAAREQLLNRLASEPGLFIEDKDWAVAIHWRQAPDRDVAGALAEEVAGGIAQATGLRLEPGKFVLELRAPGDEDKGTALRRLAASSSCTTFAYAGDDLGDLPAFATVAELDGFPLVVHGLEIADEVENVVGTHFSGPIDFADWLRRLSQA
jgi:trehalose 6-phosphate phosphatase